MIQSLRSYKECEGNLQISLSFFIGLLITATIIPRSHGLSAPPKRRIFRRPPPLSIEEELGISPTLSLLLGHDFFFDPLQICNDDNFPLLREAELKHGRIAMMATTVTVVEQNMEQIMDSFREGNTISKINVEKIIDMLLAQTHPITLFQEFAAKWWNLAILLFVAGVLETRILVQQDTQDMPGDYGLGYFFIRDKARNER
mmetsp:Transcript_14471/g.22087  ORF Transcript_14471/g.22087 Transcript_14471/m.22087 type:complete len:201 (+) Transcript_14471:48-650(+)